MDVYKNFLSSVPKSAIVIVFAVLGLIIWRLSAGLIANAMVDGGSYEGPAARKASVTGLFVTLALTILFALLLCLPDLGFFAASVSASAILPGAFMLIKSSRG
ncbi:hypothetical protein [Fimbriimonas ginsengisoli]|uniref:Uncharacterized protein n=1 Tax=Fimbriimonas ginsengisoli Gsoil 348 TaxID=661478 RepID=A0A068NR71_FIMGI|nr:hypothetical protein [Fimbriimonas ginsengisoli]AIE86033.1 hypothetical protein OP10G_2665 [Fimbriimonas ginsengisoli Gsoil 348]